MFAKMYKNFLKEQNANIWKTTSGLIPNRQAAHVTNSPAPPLMMDRRQTLLMTPLYRLRYEKLPGRPVNRKIIVGSL